MKPKRSNGSSSRAERRADRKEYANLSALGRDYRFITKDPIIDLIRSEAQIDNGGRLTPKVLAKISYDSGIGAETLKAWFFGATRFPRRLSTRFVMEAIGIRTEYFRRDGTPIRRNDQ